MQGGRAWRRVWRESVEGERGESGGREQSYDCNLYFLLSFFCFLKRECWNTRLPNAWQRALHLSTQHHV